MDIPFVLNDPDGRKVNGFISTVSGAASHSFFHVMEQREDGNYYAGQLRLTCNGWKTDSRFFQHPDLTDFLIAAFE